MRVFKVCSIGSMLFQLRYGSKNKKDVGDDNFRETSSEVSFQYLLDGEIERLSSLDEELFRGS